MTYTKEICVDRSKVYKINSWLNDEPEDETDFNENYLGEDETFSVTARFPDLYEMDIKVCGVQYTEDGNNTCYSEAVLVAPSGCVLACTEPENGFEGLWELENRGDIYQVLVKAI